MEANFNFSKEYDTHALEPINAKMRIVSNRAGTLLEVQACGKFITLEINLVENGKIRVLESSGEFITEVLRF